MKNSVIRRAAIVIIAAATVSMAAQAQQKGGMAAGGNIVVGAGDSYSNFGIGAKFFYHVTDPIRLAGEFDFFPKKDYISMWDFTVYGHYLFPVVEKVVLYPSVGLGVVGSKVSFPDFGYGLGGSASGSDFALSLGGGIDYELTSSLVLNGELRFKIMDGSRFNLALGMAYRF